MRCVIFFYSVSTSNLRVATARDLPRNVYILSTYCPKFHLQLNHPLQLQFSGYKNEIHKISFHSCFLQFFLFFFSVLKAHLKIKIKFKEIKFVLIIN